jgi:hypothetical protein
LRENHFLVKGNNFLLQEFISFEMKSFPLTGTHFIWQETFTLTHNHFL